MRWSTLGALLSVWAFLVGCQSRNTAQMEHTESEVDEIRRIDSRNIYRNYDDVYFDDRGNEISPKDR